MIQLSKSMQIKLKKLSLKYDNIFTPGFTTTLEKCRTKVCKKSNESNYNRMISQLPIGIYKSIKEIINVVETQGKNNKVNPLKFSPIAFNRKEFGPCKNLDYYKGNIITGRDEEVAKITDILCRKDKRGIMLVGLPGIGKTAVVNVLDAKLKEGTVPRSLKGCCIHNMDIPYIFSNYKEDPLGAIIRILETASADPNHILFIDEVHQLLTQRMNDVLKPYLTGKLRFIGATTTDEYHSIVNNDKALERRFNVIYIDEPSIEKTIKMVLGTKSIYETYHKCSIPRDICRYLVVNGSRFLGHRKNPDKSLDLLDMAGTILNTSEIKRTIEHKDTNEFTTLEADRLSIIGSKASTGDREITKEHIDSAISKVSGIDYNKIRHSLNYEYVCNELKLNIFGQDQQLNDISNVVNILKHINYNRQKPISVILLVGPSGCGKAESIKKLSEIIYGSSKSYIDYDLSGLTSSHMISELKGSPPGYVGYGKSGRLVKDIKNNPQSVVFLRNPELCHIDILNYILLGIKNGKLIGGDDQEAILNNTIIVFSMTLSDKEMEKITKTTVCMGFGPVKDNNTENKLSSVINEDILNVVNSSIIFNKLDKDSLEKIYINNLDKNLQMFRGVDINLNTLKQEVLQDSKNGYDVINKLETLIPKMIFKTLKEKGDKNAS